MIRTLAVIETGISSEAYWLPGAGSAFFLFGVAAAVSRRAGNGSLPVI